MDIHFIPLFQALTSLINYSFGPISVIFCGHLGALDLATVGLAISVFNVLGLAVIMGLLTACDTLFPQVGCKLLI